jgi:hypothetical protein
MPVPWQFLNVVNTVQFAEIYQRHHAVEVDLSLWVVFIQMGSQRSLDYLPRIDIFLASCADLLDLVSFRLSKCQSIRINYGIDLLIQAIYQFDDIRLN